MLCDRVGPTVRSLALIPLHRELIPSQMLLCVGSIGQLLALFMTSLCTEYYQAFLAQGVLLGVSMSLIFCPPVAVVSRRMPHRRGLALGLTIGGSSIGGIVWPIMLEQLLNHRKISFGWTMRAIAFTMIPLLGIACLTVVDAPAVRSPVSPSEAASDSNEKADQAMANDTQSEKQTDFSVLKNKSFMLLCGGLAIGYFGLFTPLFYVSAFGIARGLTSSTAFYLLSGLNAASFFGRVIPGLIADRYGHFNMCAVATLCAGIVGFCWTAATTLGGLAVWSLAYGFFSGVWYSQFEVCRMFTHLFLVRLS